MLVWLFPFLVHAQTISVTNFYLAENDLTAQGRTTTVEDQNGDKCALIRVQTTQKGFTFDVGSAGVQKIDDSKVGEIWVYVPFGVRHISIRHQELGSLSNYDFPITIQKARTYIMEITSDKVFVNRYDDTRRQKLAIRVSPVQASFTLNGMNIPLNEQGETEQELSFGTYTYKVEASGYYPKEGQVTINDSINKQTLIVDDLMAIQGTLRVSSDPYHAEIFVDGISKGQASILQTGEPLALQVGSHLVEAKAEGYHMASQTVEIEENQTAEVALKLTQILQLAVTSSPTGIAVTVDGEPFGWTPVTKELPEGNHQISASKEGYQPFQRNMAVSLSASKLHIDLVKILNYKHEFYVEANARMGSFMAMGATIGGYVSNVNIEASFFYGTDKSEPIYWNEGSKAPIQTEYQPQMNAAVRLGYGIAIGNRVRITPQVGANLMKMAETSGASTNPAEGANVLSAVAALRVSVPIINHLAISVTPEYAVAVKKSAGYEALSAVSSTIKKWGEGFNVKLGLTAFF